MLRGLVIRQGFMIMEGILGLLIIAIAVSAIRDLYAPADTTALTTPLVDSGGSTIQLKKPVFMRESYGSIIASKIFSPAASYTHNAPPPKAVKKPTKVEKVVTDSKLPLKLIGTLAAGELSPHSSANIMINEKVKVVGTFFIGSEIIDKVFLLKVFKNEVLLDNKRDNRQERLKHELDVKVASSTTGKIGSSVAAARKEASRRPSLSGRARQQKLITLDRKDIVKRIEEEYERLASTVDVLEVKDDDGKLIGLSTPNIESIGVLKELGFRNGDILVSVNNEPTTGQDQLVSLANKYRNSNVIRVGILRDDQPMNFTYRLK